MDALNSLFDSLLELITPLVMPDWGQLVLLIPFLLLLLVLAYLFWVYRAWTGYRRGLPRRLRWRPNGLTLLVMHSGGLLLGAVICALAFITGGSAEDGTLGLTVNLPMLLLGLTIVIGTTLSGFRLWEDDGRNSDGPDPAIGWYAKHGRTVSIVIQFGLGVLITAIGLIALPPADPATGEQPVATLPVLVVGLLLAITAVGRAIAGSWGRADPDIDATPAIGPGGGGQGAH
jgi:membrane protease YdiL (CAAX protease family)